MLTELIEKLHIRKKNTVTILVAALLLLPIFARPTAACVPQCPPCYYYDYDDKRCKWGCGSGQFCCDGTCCNSGTTCCDGSCCHPEYCQTCQNKQCKSTCDPDTEYCCDGTCCDWEQWCCDGTCCDPDNCEWCVGGQCQVCGGDPDKCCDNGTCVPKCNPSGGNPCSGDPPPVQYIACPHKNIDDPTCAEWAYGAICNWELVSSKGNDATCASCAPGCTISEYCKQWKPVTCDDALWYFPPFVWCQCVTTPSLYEPAYTGTHLKCN